MLTSLGYHRHSFFQVEPLIDDSCKNRVLLTVMTSPNRTEINCELHSRVVLFKLRICMNFFASPHLAQQFQLVSCEYASE